MIPRKKIDIGWFDLLYGIGRCLFPQPSNANTCKQVERLWSNDDNSLVCLSVRSGFDAVLTSLDLPKGSEVLCSAITIADMVTILKKHGLIPVPVDLDMDRLSVDMTQMTKCFTNRTKGILIAHLFGSLMPMEPVIAFARDRNLIVFEDCAQAFAGTDYKGHLESDVTMFSFGPIKTSTALGGGLFHFNDNSLRNAVDKIQSGYPTQTVRSYFSRLAKYSFLKAINNSWGFGLLYYLSHLCGTTHDRIIGASVRGFAGPDFFSRIRKRPCSALCKVLIRRITRFDSAVIESRIHNAERFISLSPLVKRPGTYALRHTHWVFPVETEEPKKFISYLWKHGIDATQGASNLNAIENPHHSAVHEPIRAKSRLERIVYIPVYESLKDKVIRKVAETVSRFK